MHDQFPAFIDWQVGCVLLNRAILMWRRTKTLHITVVSSKWFLSYWTYFPKDCRVILNESKVLKFSFTLPVSAFEKFYWIFRYFLLKIILFELIFQSSIFNISLCICNFFVISILIKLRHFNYVLISKLASSSWSHVSRHETQWAQIAYWKDQRSLVRILFINRPIGRPHSELEIVNNTFNFGSCTITISCSLCGQGVCSFL